MTCLSTSLQRGSGPNGKWRAGKVLKMYVLVVVFLNSKITHLTAHNTLHIYNFLCFFSNEYASKLKHVKNLPWCEMALLAVNSRGYCFLRSHGNITILGWMMRAYCLYGDQFRSTSSF